MKTLADLKQLIGPHLKLVALDEGHLKPLSEILFSKDTFFVKNRGLSTPDLVEAKLRDVYKTQLNNRLCLVAIDQKSDLLCGISSLINPTPDNAKIEMGFSWIALQYQRTYVNTEMKYLMLKYVFEEMKLKRVEYYIDPENEKSLAAIKKLGAVYEGILRKTRFNSPDDKGNRAIFSIIDDEWPMIKNQLELRLK
jgi:RimJ/RimL family protein N-acetyltransferase